MVIRRRYLVISEPWLGGPVAGLTKASAAGSFLLALCAALGLSLYFLPAAAALVVAALGPPKRLSEPGEVHVPGAD
jgi:hypothetical protein